LAQDEAPAPSDSRLSVEAQDVIDRFEVDPDAVTIIETDTLTSLAMSPDVSLNRLVRAGPDLILVQDDGSLIVLAGGAERSMILMFDGYSLPLAQIARIATPADSINRVDDIPDIPAFFLDNPGFTLPGSGYEQQVTSGDPLIGLPYNPLLPPTDYKWIERRDNEYGGGVSDEGGLEGLTLFQTAPILLLETDVTVGLTPAAYLDVRFEGGVFAPGLIDTVSVVLGGLPIGTQTTEGTLNASGGVLELDFTGSWAEFQALTITLPKDFSTTSRIDAPEGPLPISYSVTGVNREQATLDTLALVIEEGDASIDDTLPDTVPDETDAATIFRPSDLLLPEATDIDGSEALSRATLTIDGLPGTAQLATLVQNLPAAAQATLAQQANGSTTLTVTLHARDVGDVRAAYEALQITLAADFSTANRSDLGPVQTALPLTLTLAIQSDEDLNPFVDTANDGTVTVSRVVDIDFEVDIDLDAPSRLFAQEDDGVPASDQGVTVDLEIDIAITDADGSETADPSDPRFAASVQIVFIGLPAGTAASAGALTGNTWTGTVAEANALALDLPGDYSGSILSAITVTSPEGSVARLQEITVTPTPDILPPGPDVDALIKVTETDDDLNLLLDDFIDVVITDPDEVLEELDFAIPGLPAGTRLIDQNGNDIGTFTPSGPNTVDLSYDWLAATSSVDPRQVRLILPKDFSTESPAQNLSGSLTIRTDQGSSSEVIPVEIAAEGDIEMPDAVLALAETDDVVQFTPALHVAPVATDDDQSESVQDVVGVFNALPAGARISTDGGNNFTDQSGPYIFSGQLSDYQLLVVELPKDFSTANPATQLFMQIAATTNERGVAQARLDIRLDFELDAEVNAPPTVDVLEDGDGIDGDGVTVDMGITVPITDIDGSEDSATVEITFIGLPSGVTASTGTLTGTRWTGTPFEAEALTLGFPGDYSGQVTAEIAVISPEGRDQTDQIITITPTGDIDLVAPDAVYAETDAPLTIRPSDTWTASISDTDGNLPLETFTSVTLTLANLPAGVAALNVPAASVTFDAANGGTFTFTGQQSDYAALELVFPTDFSTESRADGPPPGPITGTLAATSTEDVAGQSIPVSLTITPEGDVAIDDTLPDTVPDETDAATLITPSDLLAAEAIDIDGSEAFASMTLTVAGMPGTVSEAALALTLPAGAQVSLSPDATGAQTLVITLTNTSVGDVRAAYDALTFTLPADFSTENRNDLGPVETTLPLTFTLDVQTDEDQDPASDTAIDGTATATREVTIGYEADITINAPTVISAQEDDGAADSDQGVTVDLNLDIAITDDDGSETADPTDPRFAATVHIDFIDLPTGTTASVGTLNGQGWDGTVAEANALALNLPGNYSGTFITVPTVTTPEGTSSVLQAVIISPTPDIIITGDIESTETDAELTLLLSDFISVAVTDPTETLVELDFILPGLPALTRAEDGNGNPVGSFSANGSLQDLTIIWRPGDNFDPEKVVLILPKDFSTENPGPDLVANLDAITDQGDRDADIDVRINAEGDILISDAAVALAETDDPVQVTLAAHVMPSANDEDSSESVSFVLANLHGLPNGAQISTDGGNNWSAASGTYLFTGDLAAYQNFVLELPADFSTANPATSVYANISAVTDEGGVGTARLDITLSVEGDLEITGTGLITVDENDPAGVIDEDSTSSAPLDIRVADAWTAKASDNDGSEAVANIRVELRNLPTNAEYSTDNGASFSAVPSPMPFVLDGLDAAGYADLVIRLPDDFSTTTDIEGTVTFTTDEAIQAGETDVDGTDGIESRDFTITVNPEADVRITGQDIEVIEDLGQPIPLNLAVAVVDKDGSETLAAPISVAFTGLPTNGDVRLTDGTVLSGPAAIWTGNATELAQLGVEELPEHFSGTIDYTVTAVTNESGPAGVSESFKLDVTPVAEPTLDLSVETVPDTVVASGDAFVVDEDTSFVLKIEAATPDQDGSEALTTVTLDMVPVGWVDAADIASLAAFAQGKGDISSATLSGTTITITLKPGVTAWTGGLSLEPSADDDRDIETILGSDLTGTVTSVDTASGLPTDTATAQDTVDIDVDAVVDGLDFTVGNITTNENVSGIRKLNLKINDLALQDSDGSETITGLELVISTVTASTQFDPGNPGQLELRVGDNSVASSVQITQTASDASSVSYSVTPVLGASQADVAAAYEALQIRVPQFFSGQLTVDGTFSWTETQTGDTEINPADNPNASTFQLVNTIRPIAQTELEAAVFVIDPATVASGSPTEISVVQTATDSDVSLSATEILTLLESTADGSGAGQVLPFVRVVVSTPDFDGSEQLKQITIDNVPSDWVGTTGTLTEAHFASADGTSALAAAEWNKVTNATYDATTGQVLLTLDAGVTSFAAALRLSPTLYEDYDVDRDNGDPFTSAGTFFGNDLVITVGADDTNTLTTDDQTTDATFDVDVDPVNNTGEISVLPQGNELDIDTSQPEPGVWQFNFTPAITDMDGSETITGVILENIPNTITMWVTDPTNPSGDKIPALLETVDIVNGVNSWSLDQNEWNSVELRGLPTHYAGEYPIKMTIITTEADGGQTGTTTVDLITYVDPVVDGGNPSERVEVDEDTMIAVPLDGNLIDNPNNSPGSPEAITGMVVISNVQPDSQGRIPRFFTSSDVADEVFLTPAGTLEVTPAQALNLHIQQGQDSNENTTFDVTMTYVETLDATELTTATGTVTVEVTGVADMPDADGQDPDPSNDPNGIQDSAIAAVFRPTDSTGGISNADLVYGYAGRSGESFALNQRLRNFDLEFGIVGPLALFTSATELSAQMTESKPLGSFDGSETLYYVISDVSPDVVFLGVQPSSADGSVYVVSEAQLPGIEVHVKASAQVEYYPMTFNAIVVEDDAAPFDPSSVSQADLHSLNVNKGYAVETFDFAIVALPADGGGGDPCTPDQHLPLPVLYTTGSGDEDTVIELTLHMTPSGPYQDLNDLVNLPNNVNGAFGIAIDLPAGAVLSSDPTGAVLLDPTRGVYVIDISKLGIDPSDPTQSSGKLLLTPPEHESSPFNNFGDANTLGPDDPYDDFSKLDASLVLENVTCGTVTSGGTTFSFNVIPVADGPKIAISGGSFDEDTLGDLGLTISEIDGGERLTGQVVVKVDSANGGALYDASGNPLNGAQQGSTVVYSIDPADLAGLQLGAGQHYSGDLSVTVEATTEDLNGDTKTNSVTKMVQVIPVADVPEFIFDDTVIDTETGQPFVDLSGTPTITAIEDVAFRLASVLDADSPDQDGSEARTITLSGVPDYLLVDGPAGNGFVNNGDGSYTMSLAAYQQITLRLKPEHARTPDALDPSIPASVPLTISVTTLEAANSDQNKGDQVFNFQVRPDADTPTLTASVDPIAGVEDDGQTYTLTLEASSPDAHEVIGFEIPAVAGVEILLDGVVQTPVGGVVTIPGTGTTASTVPDGVVTIRPLVDFAGDVDFVINAVTTDTGTLFTDTETATGTVSLSIAPAGDIDLTVTPFDTVEIDADIVITPSAFSNIAINDTDGNAPIEAVDTVTLTLANLPAGVVIGGTPSGTVTYDPAAGGAFTFTGSEAAFTALTLTFPADFNTDVRYDGAPTGALTGTLLVTSTEDSTGVSQPVSIAISATLDLTVTVDPQPDSAVQTGSDLTFDLGIDAQVTSSYGETLEEVRIVFDQTLPSGSRATSGTIVGDTLTFTRGTTSVADYATALAALALTLPGSFADTLSADVTVDTSDGTAPSGSFTLTINGQPDVSGPVQVASTETTFTIPFADLLANTTDPDTPLTLSGFATTDADVVLLPLANDLQVSVPDGYVGSPVVTYDVTDANAQPATAQASAELTIDTLQMTADGTLADPDGVTRDRMDDVTGAAAGGSIAKATAGDDAVLLDAQTPYAQIAGFKLMGGSDFINLGNSSAGFDIDLGDGDDWAIGSSGDDTLTGGTGSDRLQGGAGADRFVLDDLTSSDQILDYKGASNGTEGDQVDLTALVQLGSGQNLGDLVGYDPSTGALSVNNTVVASIETGTGFAADVEVIFEDASGAQATATI